MSGVEFGRVALCRSCGGLGGFSADETPTSTDDEECVKRCPECEGRVVLPVAQADANPDPAFEHLRYHHGDDW